MARNGKSRTGTHPGLTRTRYFPRRLVTAADLTADQDYLRERLRRHNRYLHGCGIVCGLEVGAGLIETPPSVTYGPDGQPVASSVALLPGVIVTAGYALSPQGDDVHVPAEQRLFLDKVVQQDGGCLNLTSPAPGPVRIWVALRYREEEVDPIPALPERCAQTPRCEPSRFRDGFEVVLLDFLPQGCPPLPDCEALLAELRRREPLPGLPPQVPSAAQCPPEAAEPWIVLAAVDVTVDSLARPLLTVDYTPRARRIFSSVLLGGILRCLPGQAFSRPAQVARVEPASGSVFPLLNRPTHIAAVFDNDVIPATVTGGSMRLEIETATPGARQQVGGAVSYDPALQTAVFTPTSQLGAGTYFIRVLGNGEHAVRDFDGQRLDGNADGTAGGDFQSSFKILPPPARVISVFPPNGAVFPFPIFPPVVTVTFDKDVVPETVNNQTFFVMYGGTPLSTFVFYDPAQRTATLFFPGPLFGIHVINVTGVRDLSGQDLDGNGDGIAGGVFLSSFQIFFTGLLVGDTPPGLTPEVALALRDNGITDAETLASHDRDKLAELLGLDPDAVDQLQREVRQKKDG